MLKQIGGIVSFLALALLCGAISLFNVNSTYATDSITLNIDTNNLVINSIPSSSAGDFAKSNNMNISVSTTCTSGYTLGIASSTDSTDLTNQSDNTAKITSLTSPISESDFSNSSNTQYNNKWGYKPSQYAVLDNEGHPTIYPNTNFRPLPGTTPEIIAKTECANGTAPCTNPTDTYTISIGARANNQTKPGSYNSDTFIITAVANKSVIECDSSKLCVQYNGNGLSYPETSSQLPRTVNNVNYNSTTTHISTTKYSHTSNIDDAGTQSGNYPNNASTNEVITIPGASTLHVKITYATESTSYDWAVIWAGNHPDYTAYNNYSSGITCDGAGPKLGGTTKTTKECDIQGDTVTLGFRSDSSVNNYGYYAIITANDKKDRSVFSGEYATPTGTNPTFHGWSTTQTAPGGGLPSQVEYTDESEILAEMPGDEGETKTLYAVWQQSQAITFTMDSNVTKIDVLDASGATVGTITSSGQSLTLNQGDTYTIKPTHATGYGTNAITKTSGAGTLNGKQFTVGAGSATLSVTSKAMSPIQNFNCSSLASGSTEEVYDTRDNEVYLIGKLADGNCWMLDNLRLGGSSAMNLTPSDTNINSNWTLPASTTTGFDSSTSYTTAAVNADYKSTTTTNYGVGSGKIGNYYNFCAASGGTYCYASGYGTGDARYDICPAGWRMPIGGSSGEYQALYTAYSSDATSFKNALSTPLSGSFLNGSPYGQGTYGYFWSSTYYDGRGMYRLYVASSNVYPTNDGLRYYGHSLRCLLGS